MLDREFVDGESAVKLIADRFTYADRGTHIREGLAELFAGAPLHRSLEESLRRSYELDEEVKAGMTGEAVLERFRDMSDEQPQARWGAW